MGKLIGVFGVVSLEKKGRTFKRSEF